MATCPRCGEPMNGGICNNCGFPMNRFRRIIEDKNKKSQRFRRIKWNMK